MVTQYGMSKKLGPLTFGEKEEMVFFISKDVNARIKAEALGIKARDYEKEMVEYSTLYRGWGRLLGRRYCDVLPSWRTGLTRLFYSEIPWLHSSHL